MTVYAISYDLYQPGQNYEAVRKAIESFPGAKWHCLQSSWLLDTNQSCTDVANGIWSVMDQRDKLLVTPIAPGSRYGGFDKGCTDWLNARLP